MMSDTVTRLDSEQFAPRFWQRDGSLWSSDPSVISFIESFMGWTDVAATMQGRVAEIMELVASVREEGIDHVVVCGMGGSSLCSLVLQQAAETESGFSLSVLDSTNAVAIRDLTARLDLKKTLFVVASKSGTTIEPKSFEEHFFHLVKAQVGDDAGRQFVAITDPGSPMEAESLARGYRKVFLNFADIGGRYSVLSYFGMVTAAFLGYDLPVMLRSAERVSAVADTSVKGSDAFELGVELATYAQADRDKVTFITSPSLSTFGLWAEQLIAESTGKQGKGILPIAEEPAVATEFYGADRVFVTVAAGDDEIDTDAIRAQGHPVIERRVPTASDLGYEFMAWEVATATAGAVLGINPFDQPNVQEAKDLAKSMLKQVAARGHLDEGEPVMTDEVMRLYTYPTSLGVMSVSEFLSSVVAGDYVAILAYVAETEEMTAALQSFRRSILERMRCATTFGYGPRYLHSTGQFHKGGPKKGVFLVITDPDPAKVPVPGMGFNFATLCRAQAVGDCHALSNHGQRVIRLDLTELATPMAIDHIRIQMTAVSSR